jgi:hypothetical protein
VTFLFRQFRKGLESKFVSLRTVGDKQRDCDNGETESAHDAQRKVEGRRAFAASRSNAGLART